MYFRLVTLVIDYAVYINGLALNYRSDILLLQLRCSAERILGIEE